MRYPPALLIAALLFATQPVRAGEAELPAWLGEAAPVVRQLDHELALHWQLSKIVPAAVADDRAWGRRAWLDLAGRVPSVVELDRFLNSSLQDRRERLIGQLVESPEFSLHFGRVLDGWLQQRGPGDEKFLAWLRDSLEARRSWSDIFQTVMVGPWDEESQKPSARFLTKRLKSLDNLTSDTARAFFGVDISCARCHDHPLVDDWKQDHYYGLAAFLNRTTETGKNSGAIAEKPEGEVTFARRSGEQRTAEMMFLSGRTFASAPKQNRRAQLVEAVLEDKRFLSRSAVNRVWAWLLGRGLVHPVDQMHSGNPPAIPPALDLLAEDFVASGYDLRRLVAVIALSRAYQSSSQAESAMPPLESFAAYRLKPLTAWQLAMSWAFVASEPLVSDTTREARREAFLRLETQAAELAASLDPATDDYQASAAEALFVSHHAAVQKLLEPSGQNLAARLAAIDRLDERIAQAWLAVFGRLPSPAEQQLALAWLDNGETNASQATAPLLWALLASPEFRFNH